MNFDDNFDGLDLSSFDEADFDSILLWETTADYSDTQLEDLETVEEVLGHPLEPDALAGFLRAYQAPNPF